MCVQTVLHQADGRELLVQFLCFVYGYIETYVDRNV